MDYYAVDVHKKYSVYVCGNRQGEVLRKGRVANTREELIQMVAPSAGMARVVLESTGNWSFIYDTLEPWVGEIILAHSKELKAIAHARVKSDGIDADTLFHLLRADLIPAAYIPPREVRDLRDWLRSRTAIVRMGTQLKNRIHALLAKNGLSSPVTDLFGRAGREWLKGVELAPIHREILDRYLRIVDALEVEIKVTNGLVEKRARADSRARLLMTIPGIGALTALLILAEIGDIHRFHSHRHLVSYAGLAPRVRSSGGHTWRGSITKEGTPWLRWILTEAAVTAAQHSGRLGSLFYRVQQRHGKQTAAIAVARELLVIVYYVLKTKRIYEERG